MKITSNEIGDELKVVTEHGKNIFEINIGDPTDLLPVTRITEIFPPLTPTEKQETVDKLDREIVKTYGGKNIIILTKKEVDKFPEDYKEIPILREPVQEKFSDEAHRKLVRDQEERFRFTTTSIMKAKIEAFSIPKHYLTENGFECKSGDAFKVFLNGSVAKDRMALAKTLYALVKNSGFLKSKTDFILKKPGTDEINEQRVIECFLVMCSSSTPVAIINLSNQEIVAFCLVRNLGKENGFYLYNTFVDENAFINDIFAKHLPNREKYILTESPAVYSRLQGTAVLYEAMSKELYDKHGNQLLSFIAPPLDLGKIDRPLEFQNYCPFSMEEQKVLLDIVKDKVILKNFGPANLALFEEIMNKKIINFSAPKIESSYILESPEMGLSGKKEEQPKENIPQLKF